MTLADFQWMPRRIPVFEPRLGGEDVHNVTVALLNHAVSGHSGHFIEQFEREFADFCGVRHGIAVSSGSTALHLAAVVAGIKPGDDVLVSALTNIATANAVVQCGARVIPVDSSVVDWNMAPFLVEERRTSRTTAIMPVHIYGHPLHIDRGDYPSLWVIEDAAEAHGAEIDGQRVGSFGHMACFSFYANKVITTGEGGMIVTDNDELAERARSLRNLAFGNPRFLHERVGFNYRMSNLAAAIGCGQMTRIDSIIDQKRDLARRYTERLSYINGLQLPTELPGYKNVYWMYCIVVNEAEFGVSRDRVMERLREAGIDTRTMFCPLNLQPALLNIGAVDTAPCPVAERLWREGMYLPSTPTLSDADLDYICDTIKAVKR